MARPMKNEKGFALIEVVIAIALLGIIGAGFLMALSGASKALILADERTTAESLARSQMEYVKSQGYASSYDTIATPANYTIVSPITVEALQTGLQKITVIVKHYTKEVITLEGYKVDR